jgi:uncharacterized protein
VETTSPENVLPELKALGVVALGRLGFALPVVPDPVNLFQDSGPQHGRLIVGTAASRPGDAISLRAQRNLIFVLTACSVDHPPLNNGCCGPLLIEVKLGAS